MTSKTSDRMATAEARAVVYRLLARGFAYPDPDALAGLLEEDLPLAADAAETLGDDVAEPVAAMGHRLAHSDPAAVAQDYERTFTHVVSVDWPPYETAYTSRGIFQQANDLADVAAFYAAYGVEVSEDAGERADHVAVEMEFMHLLTFKEAHALRHHTKARADGCRRDQRRFLETHLGRWAPDFARRLARGMPGSPYSDLAEACVAFLERELALLNVTPDAAGDVVEDFAPVSDECGPCVFRPDGRPPADA